MAAELGIGFWRGPREAVRTDADSWSAGLEALRAPVYAVLTPGGVGLTNLGSARLSGWKWTGAGGSGAQEQSGALHYGDSQSGVLHYAEGADGDVELPLLAWTPALLAERLGSAAFRDAYGVRHAYVGGEMANGIASVEYVVALAGAGMIGFFGAAGLAPAAIERGVRRIQDEAAGLPYGSNLIHSPHDPALENATVDLYLRLGVRNVCASAFLGLTPALVRYRVAGLRSNAMHRLEAGATQDRLKTGATLEDRLKTGATREDRLETGPICTNRLIAKVSRVEVARKFLSPAPEKMLRELVVAGHITAEQAKLAEGVPLCDDLTAEADSGGHTDNRPAITLIPTMIALRDEIAREFAYASPPRVGAAGGIATPASVAAAFAMGAAYVVTGSINQGCVEAGTSDTVRQMLAEAQQADVMMAPAADMFEMGVQVQVLKRGTLFPVRARKLYELYRQYTSLDEIPAAQREVLESDFFRAPLAAVWDGTRRYFESRDPAQIARAEREPRHLMALVFRAYLGQSSKWANSGEPTRKQDYQVWCGPAMGAFNEWVRGSCLEPPRNRKVATIAMNLLHGAAKLTRAAWLRAQGVGLPPEAEQFRPREIGR